MASELNGQNVVVKINAIYSSLSSKEKAVADYILKNTQEIIHLSITEFAEHASVAEATIFRFCKRLGFRGYQAFKIAMASELVEPIKNIHEEIKEEDEVVTLAQKVFAGHIEAMKETLNLLDAKVLENIIDVLGKATRIDFYGSGGSSAIALDAYHKFLRTGIHCNAHSDGHQQIISAALLGPGQAAIGISHSGSNKDVIEALKIAKANGAVTIAITGHYKSPLSKEADFVLYTTSRETLFRSEALASRLVQLSLIDVLHVAVSVTRQEQTLGNLQKIREAISIKRI
ncbi:MurR/RpiR family transcriptional regulator [Mesobacillus selenatarsenatis]|uniref:MurR/RpiR family transcriptional regulator n=1 Tax=Mesobacillus selenatarsenatis TaxID=388741 RepID=A0A846TE87_9BACI|nr:MurR/RpiR family transcriptional regulator [Mesobacillus selenatarsenatis]NKE06843.1 MurR/RpiR family transcriptional regulator [Mesobacillus selenatarsenatis]